MLSTNLFNRKDENREKRGWESLKKADLISEEPDLVHGGRSDLEDDVRLEGRGLVHDFRTGAFVI